MDCDTIPMLVGSSSSLPERPEPGPDPGREPPPSSPPFAPSVSPAVAVAVAVPRFACPFIKRYGLNGTKGRACTGKGWSDIHRLKEHLYRSHSPTISCPRCHVVIEEQTALETHLNLEPICDKRPAPHNDQASVLTDAHVKELRKKRKRKDKVNEKDQWKDIYNIIFPNESVIPSPYILNAELEQNQSLQDHLRAELRKLLKEVSNDPKYAAVHSSWNTFSENFINSGLFDTAYERASNKDKRRRSPSPQEDSRRVRTGQGSIVPKENEAQDEDERVECGEPSTLLDNPHGQRSHASAFPADFLDDAFAILHTVPTNRWMPAPAPSFCEAPTLLEESPSKAQVDHSVEPGLAEQAADDWFVFSPDSNPLYSSAYQQDQEAYPAEWKSN